MKKFDTLLCIGFAAYVSFGMAYRLYEDFSHPERWGENLSTDPRIYLPAWGLAAVVGGVVVWRVCRESYRKEILWRERFSAFKRDVTDKQREGNWEEAAEAMRYYEALLKLEAENRKNKKRWF